MPLWNTLVLAMKRAANFLPAFESEWTIIIKFYNLIVFQTFEAQSFCCLTVGLLLGTLSFYSIELIVDCSAYLINPARTICVVLHNFNSIYIYILISLGSCPHALLLSFCKSALLQIEDLKNLGSNFYKDLIYNKWL